MSTTPASEVDTFESAPCGYVVVDQRGVIARANAEFLRLLGSDADEVVGVRTFSSLVSPGGQVLLETHVRPILDHAGVVRELALELVRSDGGRVPVLMNARLVDGPARTVLVVLVETRDRHRYEDYLLAAKAAAERAGQESAVMAETLQQTLIPPRPPVVPHLEIGAAYRPAGSGHEVGGDFYDVFQVAPDAWEVVLGDVSGKGINAAVVTSFVRHTVRSEAIAHPDPADLLHALDVAMREHGTEHHCTLAVVRLDRGASGWTLALSLAGHPPALVRRPDGQVVELGVPGTPAGLVTDPAFCTVHHQLGDDLVTLFTDGVTEARAPTGELFGDDRLVELLAGGAGDPHVTAAQVVAEALSWQAENASDDIAVVSFAAASG
jgi:sigma-B regulation protein RsbU (phosphoserine phosphatase)